jgi:hypothetical protein
MEMKLLNSYLKQTKMSFFENRMIKQVLPRGWFQWEGERCKERV